MDGHPREKLDYDTANRQLAVFLLSTANWNVKEQRV